MSWSDARLPNAEETLLVRAALAPASVALAAWHQWRALGGDLDRTDTGRYALFPIVYRNLAAAGAEDPDMERLHGIYRRTWYRNRLASRGLEETIDLLAEKHIPVMLLKGTALIAGYGAEPGAWHMADADVLVPEEQVAPAATELAGRGWSRVREGTAFETEARYRQAVAVRSAQGFEIDIHGIASWENRWAGADVAIWAHARRVTWNGRSVLVPSPEHLVVNVIQHALRVFTSFTMRWTADVAQVLAAAGPSFDWALVVHEARARHAGHTVGSALAYLRDAVGTQVPDATLDALMRPEHVPVRERLAGRLARAEGRWATRWGYRGAMFLFASQRWAAYRVPAEIPPFIAYSWGLDGPRQLPGVAARKAKALALAAAGRKQRNPHARWSPPGD